MKSILAFFFFMTSTFAIMAAQTAIAQKQGLTLPHADFSELKRVGTAEVVSIIDPQTVQLHDGQIIRLSGVDFPDLKVHEAGDFSVTTMRVLKDMLLNQGVNIYQTKKADRGRVNRMGHQIAHLERIADGIWVQGTLISLGLARVRTTQRTPEMAEQMYALEQNARTDKLGLWEMEKFNPLLPNSAAEHVDSFQIIEGRIKSTALKNNRIYLNFGKDWRSDFTVSIAPDDKRSFSKAGLDPLGWGGKTVRVRGWLESYNGPYIEITHPQAIEILNASAANALPAQ